MLIKRRPGVALLLAAIWVLWPAAGRSAAQPLSGPPQLPELASLLDVMGRVAGLYRDNALSFTCVERITDTRYRVQNRVAQRTTHLFDYFYVFDEAPASDLSPDEEVVAATETGAADVDASAAAGTAVGRLQDYRTERGQTGDGALRRVLLRDFGLPAYLERAYSWVFVFQPGLRDYFEFTLEGREEIDGRPAFVVRFDPRAPYEAGQNDWFGRAWIDADRFQLLRVDAVQSQEALAALRAGGAVAAPVGGYLFTWARVEFEQDTNGMRFPSRAMLFGAGVSLSEPIDESYRTKAAEMLDDGIDHDRLFRVEHRYSDYRFFSVRTATEIQLTLDRQQ